MAFANPVSPDDTTHDDCPVLGKTRYVSVNKGQYAVVRWPLRDSKGNAVDLTAWLSSSSSSDLDSSKILVRIADALDPSGYPIQQIVGSVVDYENGIVEFALPDNVTCDASIFTMEIGVIDSAGRLVGSEKGYVSVERGLFGNLDMMTGPPTIDEIRMQLRDRLLENDLLSDVEFDDVEIIHSILRPIQEWNELPPDLGWMSPNDFPWHFHWVNAVIANLLLIAAHWYERNNLPAQHGGLNVQDRAKANPYLNVAMALRQEWRNFIARKKAEINNELGMSDFGSDYD